MAADCGVTRNILAWDKPDAFGFDDEHGWNAHIEGACGEVAAAKALGRFWSPSVNTFDAADIGLRLQVRTRSRHEYELYVRPRDVENHPDHAMILVTGKAPLFVVRGYIIAKDACRDDWLKEYGSRPPAWFVPQQQLLDIDDLKYREPRKRMV